MKQIKINIQCEMRDNILYPDTNGSMLIWVLFHEMTCDIHWKIEKLMKDNGFQEDRIKDIYIDQIIDCSFIEEYNKESLLKHTPMLIDCILDRYRETFEISEIEQEEMDKQSSIFFNGKAVENSCEGINLYCLYSSFWEKFGLNRNDLKELPYKEYLLLKYLLIKETEVKKVNNKSGISHKDAGKFTKIKGIRTTGQSQIVPM